MKKKTGSDGYESGGPLMWGWRIDGLLPKSNAFQRPKSTLKATIEIDAEHMHILEREASRRHKPAAQFMSGLLEAQAEALR